MPTEHIRPASFLAGETDDPDDDGAVVSVPAPRRTRPTLRWPWQRYRLTRGAVGSAMQIGAALMLLGGAWEIWGIGVTLIAGAVELGAAGVLVEMGRI